jgi:hypothetical protein
MFDLEGQQERVAPDSAPQEAMPLWRKPVITVLDVERGTLTTTGFSADFVGSSS